MRWRMGIRQCAGEWESEIVFSAVSEYIYRKVLKKTMKQNISRKKADDADRTDSKPEIESEFRKTESFKRMRAAFRHSHELSALITHVAYALYKP